MGAHEAPDAVLTRLEADRLRARALELVMESDTLNLLDGDAMRAWIGSASVILAELARG